jgi:hypothetical protein
MTPCVIVAVPDAGDDGCDGAEVASDEVQAVDEGGTRTVEDGLHRLQHDLVRHTYTGRHIQRQGTRVVE